MTVNSTPSVVTDVLRALAERLQADAVRLHAEAADARSEGEQAYAIRLNGREDATRDIVHLLRTLAATSET